MKKIVNIMRILLLISIFVHKILAKEDWKRCNTFDNEELSGDHPKGKSYLSDKNNIKHK